MNRDLRKAKLLEVQNSTPYMTGIRIQYKGENQSFNVYKIPLKYLVYNKYNGRIGSLVKSFEKQNHTLDATNPNDIEIIEKFLLEINPQRNDYTMNSLAEEGQRVYGIVTNDGVIVDGNRRAVLLNKIYKNREQWRANHVDVDASEFFIAAILPEDIGQKDIVRLETEYQMGEDAKLEYNPIEKYLRSRDLKEVHDFQIPEIARMMGESKSDIEKYLEILEVMEDYLDYLGYDGIYTRLEKREGQFVDLTSYLRRYKNGNSAMANWNYEEDDIACLQAICYDYIRAQYEGKEFRYIAQPSKSNSAFCKKNVWDVFSNDHLEDLQQIQEKPLNQYIDENPDGDYVKLLRQRDEEWTEAVENNLKKNLGKAKRQLEDLNEADQPLQLAQRAYNTLLSINKDSDSFVSEDVALVLKQIGSMCYEYGKIIKNEMKK